MKNIKRTVITAMAVISILAFSACGNVDAPTSEVKPAPSSSVTDISSDSDILSGSESSDPDESQPDNDGNDQPGTSQTTEGAVTSAVDDNSETPKVTTTTAENSGATEKKTTTTTKVTTTAKKPQTAKTTVTTTVKKTETKKTTTTAKKVTTTKKKTTTTKKVTTTKKPPAKPAATSTTMWIKERCFFYEWNGSIWVSDNNVINKGEKVTAYESITLDGEKFTKVKTSSGKSGAVKTKYLSKTEVVAKLLTQSDINRLVKELQEYSDEIYAKREGCFPYEDFEPYTYTTEKGTFKINNYEEYMESFTPEECSWTGAATICPWNTYEKAYEYGKLEIDIAYECFNGHAVVYVEWCPDGKGCVNGSVTEDCWNLYALV